MSELIRCSNCCLPETSDGLKFDDQGVCNVCNQNKVKTEVINWEERGEMLKEICDKVRGKHTYDCIVPFSGGKDSTYTVWYLVEKCNLKPLVVSFDHGFYRPLHLENRARTLKKLGVDFVTFKVNPDVTRELMLESLKRKGDFCWHCHCGVYVYPVQMALRYKIPLIFWGQPDAEYGSYGYSYEEIQKVDEKQFNRFINLGITAEDMVGMVPDWITLKDLDIFRYPAKDKLRELGLISIHLGSYIPWNTRHLSNVIRENLDWQFTAVEGIPEEYGWEKVECMFTGIRDYLKFMKRGFGRTTHLASIDIREGVKTRDEGVKLIQEYDGKRPASLDVFLELIGITEDEFNEIAMQHCVAPYQHDPSKISNANKLWDHDMWSKMLGL